MTLCALGLSWKHGGPIAVVMTLVAAMWVFQLGLYMIATPFVGNMMSCMIDGALLLVVSTLSRSRPLMIVAAALASQLFLHFAFRQGHLDDELYYVAINVLYLVELLALGWSGGRIVLDTLGDWVADVWRSRRNTVASFGSETATRGAIGCGQHKSVVRNGRGSSV